MTDKSEFTEKLRALIEAAEHLNSDQAYIICRDENQRVISVAVVTVDEEAVALAKWLERRGRTAKGGAQ